MIRVLFRLFILLIRSIISVAVFLIIVALVALLYFGGTSIGQQQLANLIENHASNDQQRIEISPIRGLLSGDPKVDEFRMINTESNQTWLEAENFALDWQITDLFGRSVTINDIRADRLFIGQPPVSTADTEDESATSIEPPQLPVDIQIKSWSFPNIELGADLVGQEVTLGTTGRLLYPRDASKILLDANIARNDGIEGNLDANILYEPEDHHLTAKINAAEHQDGFIAPLFGWPSDSAIAFNVDGEGPLNKWRANSRLIVDETEYANLDIAIDKAIDKTFDKNNSAADGEPHYDVSLSGPLRLADIAKAQLPENTNLAAVLKGTTTFNLDASYAPNHQRLQVAQLKLAHPTWNLAAAAEVDLSDNGQQVTLSAFDITTPENTPLSIQIADTEIRLDTFTNALDLNQQTLTGQSQLALASLESAGTRVENMTVRADIERFDLGAMKGAIDFDAAVQAIDAPQSLPPIAQNPLALNGRATLQDNQLTLETTTLEAGRDRLQLSGNYSLATSAFDAMIDGTLFTEDLLPQSNPDITNRLGDKISINTSLNGQVAKTLTLTIEQLDLQTAHLNLNALANIEGDALTSSVSLTIPELTDVEPSTSGRLVADLNLQGRLSDMTASLSASSEQLGINDQSINNFTLDAQTRLIDYQPDSTVRINGDYNGQPIALSADIKPKDGDWRIQPLTATIADNQLNGNVDIQDGIPVGELNLDLQDLAAIGRLANTPLNGTLTGDLDFNNDQQPTALLSLNSASLSAVGVSLNNLSLNATVQDWLNAPQLNSTVNIDRLIAANNTINDIDFSAEGTAESLDLAASLRYQNEPTVFEGQLSSQAQATTLTVNQLITNYQGLRAELLDTPEIRLTPSINIPALRIAVADGVVNLEGGISEPLDAQINVQGVQATPFASFAPALSGLQGTLDGSITLNGNLNNPNANFNLTLNAFDLDQLAQRGIEPLDVQVTGNYQNQQVNIENFNVLNAQGLDATSSGNIDLANRQMDVQLDTILPMRLVETTLSEQNLIAEGAINANVNISGPLASPAITGQIQSDQLSVTDATTGMSASPVTIDIGLENNQATINTFNADLRSGGSISAQGNVGLNPANGLPMAIQIDLNNAAITDGEVIATILRGQISIEGDALNDLLISGNINVGESNINIPSALPGNVKNLNVRHVNASDEVMAQQERLSKPNASQSDSDILLDLTINAPNQIFVRGRGMDVELGGELRLEGPVNNPRTIGGLEIQRGRLNFLEKRLDFTEGTIGFSGSIIPMLDFTAVRNSGDVDITIQVQGLATDPELIFSSSPELPQDELLAQLLFERSYADLSTFQIIQLAQATAQLTGQSSGTSLTGEIRDALGVDDIDIITDPETGEISVQVGKYLNDNTYATVQQGPEPEDNKATIDLSIGRDIKLRGEANQAGEGKVGIFYEREY